MDEQGAWNRFFTTGRIEDYLIYRQAAACRGNEKFGEMKNEGQYRGAGAGRAEAGRGKTPADNTYTQ